MVKGSKSESPLGKHYSIVTLDDLISEADSEEKAAWRSNDVSRWLKAFEELTNLKFKKFGERAKVDFRHD